MIFIKIKIHDFIEYRNNCLDMQYSSKRKLKCHPIIHYIFRDISFVSDNKRPKTNNELEIKFSCAGNKISSDFNTDLSSKPDSLT